MKPTLPGHMDKAWRMVQVQLDKHSLLTRMFHDCASENPVELTNTGCGCHGKFCGVCRKAREVICCPEHGSSVWTR